MKIDKNGRKYILFRIHVYFTEYYRFYRLQRMKNTQSKIKWIKTKKELGTTYCLRCKDYTHNFKPQEVKMTNKVLREKSNWFVCQSNKSRFLKQKHCKKKIFFTSFKTCIYIVKTVKNTQVSKSTFAKKLILISKNKMKGKSKCSEYLIKELSFMKLRRPNMV